jgi:hypothetical protein
MNAAASPYVQGWIASDSAQEDKIAVKRSYIDINGGNLFDGIIFSQLMYWHTNDKHGKPRMEIFKDGFLWVAKGYKDWWEECRISAATARKCLSRIAARGLIVMKTYKFRGSPTLHIRIDFNAFEKCIKSMCPVVSNQSDTTGQIKVIPQVISITDTTTETTSETTEKKKIPARDLSNRPVTKKTSPVGEIKVLPVVTQTPEPEAVKVWKPNDPEMQTAIQDGLKVKPGGFNGTLARQLLGLSDKGERKSFLLSPPMTPVEVVAFGQWFHELYPNATPPTSAERLRDRVQQFRDDTTKHAKKMALSVGRLARLLAEKTGQQVSPAVPKTAPSPAQPDKPLDMNTTPDVREDEVAKFVEMGLMQPDEMPRPSMKTIYDRIAAKMGSNNHAAS